MRIHIGKWGKHQRQVVTDRKIRQIVEACVALPGYEVFKYVDEKGETKDVKSRDLNVYVKEARGDEFTTKDFRTWAGTLIAAVKRTGLGATEDVEQGQRNGLEAVDAVAQRLGNTRNIARSSYINLA
jgi:DNA topoisomerase-1